MLGKILQVKRARDHRKVDIAFSQLRAACNELYDKGVTKGDLEELGRGIPGFQHADYETTNFCRLDFSTRSGDIIVDFPWKDDDRSIHVRTTPTVGDATVALFMMNLAEQMDRYVPRRRKLYLEP